MTNMKKLVLGALLAVASSVGCGTSGGGDVTVDVSWSFTHFATNAPRSCPTGYGTANIVSQTTDDTTHLGAGAKIIDKFNCSDGGGTIVLPDNDTFLVWVEITSDSGGSLYAQTEETFVDTAGAVPPINVEIFDDAGFFFLEWDLVDARNRNAPLTCDQAGVAGASGAIDASATVAGGSRLFTDKFTCSDHFGTTDPILAGTYTVSVSATVNDIAVGTAPELTNRTIGAPNKLTDLGLVLIPIN